MKCLHALLVAALLAFASYAAAQSQPIQAGSVLASASRTAATVNSGDQTNCCFRGATVVLDVSARVSGTYTLTIQGKDPVSGNYYTILTGSGVSSVSTNVYRVYPGITATANASVSEALPKTWRVQLAGTATPSMTLSVSVNLLN